jgi:hypothetical protein
MKNFKLQPKHFALISFVTLMLMLMVVALIGSQTRQEYRSKAAYPTEPPTCDRSNPCLDCNVNPPCVKDGCSASLGGCCSGCVRDGQCRPASVCEPITPTSPPPTRPVATNTPVPPEPTNTPVPGATNTPIPPTPTLGGPTLTPTPTSGPGQILGFIFKDKQPNAVRQSDESVIANIRLQLLKDGTTAVGDATSGAGDNTSNYKFENVAAGNYWIKALDYTGPLVDCTNVQTPSPIPSDNRYFYCADTSTTVVIKKWTPDAPNPFEDVANNLFPVNSSTTYVDFPVCIKKDNGDANCDGVVDGIDYSIWLNSQCPPTRKEGSVCASYKADFNKDNNVDDTDYAIWLKGSRT